jgi:hypothetical protein
MYGNVSDIGNHVFNKIYRLNNSQSSKITDLLNIMHTI